MGAVTLMVASNFSLFFVFLLPLVFWGFGASRLQL